MIFKNKFIYKLIIILSLVTLGTLSGYEKPEFKLIDYLDSFHNSGDVIEDMNRLQSKYHLRVSKKRDWQLGGIIIRDFKFHGGNQPIVTQTGLMFAF
jgi:hypothetical protein